MSLQIINCRSYTFVDLDLFNAGIALDVKDAIGNEQVLVEFLRAANVQDRIGIPIELTNFFQRQAGCWVFRQITRTKCPA